MAKSVAQSIGGWLRTFAIGRRPEWTIVRILLLVTVTFILLKYVIMLRRIESISMMPTFQEGSIRVISRIAYSGDRKPQRGDIVALRTSGETILYIKRVIGLPGETISIRSGIVHINGEPLEEPYIPARSREWNLRARTLGSNEYYVIGDNRSMPQDRHVFGPVQAHRIIGKVIW